MGQQRAHRSAWTRHSFLVARHLDHVLREYVAPTTQAGRTAASACERLMRDRRCPTPTRVPPRRLMMVAFRIGSHKGDRGRGVASPSRRAAHETATPGATAHRLVEVRAGYGRLGIEDAQVVAPHRAPRAGQPGVPRLIGERHRSGVVAAGDLIAGGGHGVGVARQVRRRCGGRSAKDEQPGQDAARRLPHDPSHSMIPCFRRVVLDLRHRSTQQIGSSSRPWRMKRARVFQLHSWVRFFEWSSCSQKGFEPFASGDEVSCT